MRKITAAILILTAFAVGYVLGVNNWLREYECSVRIMPLNVCIEYQINKVKYKQLRNY